MRDYADTGNYEIAVVVLATRMALPKDVRAYYAACEVVRHISVVSQFKINYYDDCTKAGVKAGRKTTNVLVHRVSSSKDIYEIAVLPNEPDNMVVTYTGKGSDILDVDLGRLGNVSKKFVAKVDGEEVSRGDTLADVATMCDGVDAFCVDEHNLPFCLDVRFVRPISEIADMISKECDIELNTAEYETLLNALYILIKQDLQTCSVDMLIKVAFMFRYTMKEQIRSIGTLYKEAGPGKQSTPKDFLKTCFDAIAVHTCLPKAMTPFVMELDGYDFKQFDVFEIEVMRMRFYAQFNRSGEGSNGFNSEERAMRTEKRVAKRAEREEASEGAPPKKRRKTKGQEDNSAFLITDVDL
jgi:hypothetical protein